MSLKAQQTNPGHYNIYNDKGVTVGTCKLDENKMWQLKIDCPIKQVSDTDCFRNDLFARHGIEL